MRDNPCVLIALYGLLLTIWGCGQSSTSVITKPPTVGGLVLENQSTKEIIVLNVSFDGRSELPAIALGAGASKTLMGRIDEVKGLPEVRYTYGNVDDASILVALALVRYSGGLDHLVLRLDLNDSWVMIGMKAQVEVFRSLETSRVDIPADKPKDTH